MFAVGLAELLVLLTLVVLGVLLVVRLTSGGRRVPSSRETRLVALTRVAGVLVGVAAGAALLNQGSYGTGAMLAPAAAGLCLLLAVALGETVVRPRRPRKEVGARSASLRPRRVRDYLPRALSLAVGVQLVATTAVLLLTTLTAGAGDVAGGDPALHDDGLTGRSISCTAGGYGSSHTPYPGSFYSGPLAVALLAVLAVAVVAALQVVRRPRGLGPTDADDALRRRSLGVVVAATGFAVSATYAGIAVTAGIALQGLADQTRSCAAGWMQPVGIALTLSTLPAAVLIVTCLVQLVVGRAQVPAPGYPPTPERAERLPR